jgi:cobalamin biosynthesis protein CobT
MKHTQVSIPHETRTVHHSPSQSPGPGTYETEVLTSLATKLEAKNHVHSHLASEDASVTTKSTSGTLSRPTSKTAMMKYFEKSRTSTSYSWLMKESDREERNLLAQESKQNEKDQIDEDSNDSDDDDDEDDDDLREKDSKDSEDDSDEMTPSPVTKKKKAKPKVEAEAPPPEKKQAPWRNNQEFISFLKDLESQEQMMKLEGLHQASALNTRSLLLNNSSIANNQSKLKSLFLGAKAQKHLFGSGVRRNQVSSLKSLGKTTLANAFSHN